MIRNYLRTIAMKVMPSLPVLALSLAPLTSRADENIYSANGVSSAKDSYVQAGLEYFPLGKNKISYLEAHAAFGESVGGSGGLVVRSDAHGYNGDGVNVFGEMSEKDSLFSAGLEKLAPNNQIFINCYFGKIADQNISGADAGVLINILDKKNLSLDGIVGAYYFNGEEKSSIGARLGARAEVPLRKDNGLKLVFQGDFFTDDTYLGEYNVRAGLNFSFGKNEYRPVQRLEINNFCLNPRAKEVLIEDTPVVDVPVIVEPKKPNLGSGKDTDSSNGKKDDSENDSHVDVGVGDNVSSGDNNNNNNNNNSGNGNSIDLGTGGNVSQ